ncbi:hypothetical protein C8N40_106164 [Pontibacter mucosus]|uniref:Uncharacterized protein n=1 Tax=Pontibacter mucosus TaxID=1649266 RepID=A0A2T5YGE4_9BACT|nr:hypothetical protein C8N40_106164 [Pontibacter mucosus]
MDNKLKTEAYLRTLYFVRGFSQSIKSNYVKTYFIFFPLLIYFSKKLYKSFGLS